MGSTESLVGGTALSAGAPHCNKCTQHVAGAAARCTAHAHTVCCAALQTWGAAWLRTVAIQAVCTDMATPTAIPTAGATHYLPSAAPSASVVCFLSSSINCCRCSRNARRWSCRVAHDRVAASEWQQQQTSPEWKECDAGKGCTVLAEWLK